jgi:uncharacterized membrane protein
MVPLDVARFIATWCTSIFAGACVYITLVEHPVRAGLDTRSAIAQWAPSYARATLMQAPLAVISFVAGATAWFLGGGTVWLVGAVLIGAVVPFTLLVIMPTNRALLAPDRDRASPEARALLSAWGRLHAVRTVLGVAASVLMLWRLLQ